MRQLRFQQIVNNASYVKTVSTRIISQECDMLKRSLYSERAQNFTLVGTGNSISLKIA